MKAIKSFSVTGLALITASIACQLVFKSAIDAKFVFAVGVVLSIVIISLTMKIEQQSRNPYKMRKVRVRSSSKALPNRVG